MNNFTLLDEYRIFQNKTHGIINVSITKSNFKYLLNCIIVATYPFFWNPFVSLRYCWAIMLAYK